MLYLWLLIPGSIILNIILYNFRLKQSTKAFRELADRLNLSFSKPKGSYFTALIHDRLPKLTGQHEEQLPIRVWVIYHGIGKSKDNSVSFSFEVTNKQNTTFTLMPEAFVHKIGKAIGTQKDIQVRDPEFDKTYLIKSNNSLFAKQLLMDATIREPFIQSADTFAKSKIELEGKRLITSIQMTLSFKNVDRLEKAIKVVAKLAQQVENMEAE